MARFIVDENVSTSLPAALRASGHDAVHVNSLGLNASPDAEIMLRAAQRGATIITHDSDFVANLATLGATRPSVIRVVQAVGDGVARKEALAARLAEVLPAILPRLAEGVAVRLGRTGLEVATLPLDHGRERRRRPPADRTLGRSRT